MSAEEQPNVELPLSWVGVDELPVLFVNQILVQQQPGEFIVSFGTLTPPAVIGSPEDQLEQIREIEFVPIRPLARFGMTPLRVRELIAALQLSIDRHDAQTGGDPR